MKNIQNPLLGELNNLSSKYIEHSILNSAEIIINKILKKEIDVYFAEEIIFNLETLFFVDKLENKKLSEIIEYGMELSDIQELVSKPKEIYKACKEILNLIKSVRHSESEKQLQKSHYLTRNKGNFSNLKNLLILKKPSLLNNINNIYTNGTDINHFPDFQYVKQKSLQL